MCRFIAPPRAATPPFSSLAHSPLLSSASTCCALSSIYFSFSFVLICRLIHCDGIAVVVVLAAAAAVDVAAAAAAADVAGAAAASTADAAAVLLLLLLLT